MPTKKKRTQRHTSAKLSIGKARTTPNESHVIRSYKVQTQAPPHQGSTGINHLTIQKTYHPKKVYNNPNIKHNKRLSQLLTSPQHSLSGVIDISLPQRDHSSSPYMRKKKHAKEVTQHKMGGRRASMVTNTRRGASARLTLGSDSENPNQRSWD